jgi:hypothetical protein
VSCRDSTASTLFTKPDDTQCKVNALPLKIGAGRGSFGEGLKTGVAENWINLLPSSSNAHNFLLLAFFVCFSPILSPKCYSYSLQSYFKLNFYRLLSKSYVWFFLFLLRPGMFLVLEPRSVFDHELLFFTSRKSSSRFSCKDNIHRWSC